jgi:glycerol-3-phosphate dehydrogenase
MRAAPEGALGPREREDNLRAMARESFDLVVVGGGITGAGVARDASLRGIRVALLEQGDFANGTSSRSSKIIHGGVRYLEYLQLGMVRESALERSVLRRIAPHLVHALPFLYPVFAGESLLKVRMGLRLFDFMAGARGDERSVRLDAGGTRERLPGLRDPLKGAVLYPEFITDDARFTFANIASAAAHGARVLSYARVDTFLFRGGRVVGVAVRDLETNERFEVLGAVTVNAAGPWVPDLHAAASLSALPEEIVRSKGAHILLDRDRLPIRAATFLRSPGGRRGLVMPRGPWVYVGTSDEEYSGDVARPRAEPAEVMDLLAMAAECFPTAGLTARDVHASWAGVRPLVHQPGKSTRETSRHDHVWLSAPGLVTVAGGKLTTYRRMARRILEAVSRAWGRSLPGTERTHLDPLPGAPSEALGSFRSRTRRALEAAGVPAAAVERIEFLYGTQSERLLAFGTEDPGWLEPLAQGVPALRGEVRLAIEQEMARTLVDILDRRLALLLFSPKGGWDAAPETAAIAGEILGWNGARREQELYTYKEMVREHGPLGRGTAPGYPESSSVRGPGASVDTTRPLP